MRIAYVITRMDEFGGPQIHVRDFCRRLQSLGHSPYVIAGSAGSITDELQSQGIPCTIIPEMTRAIGLKREIAALFRLRDTLKQIKPDLVSCHSSKAGVIGRLAAWLAGYPAIFTVHGWAFTENVRPWPRRMYQVIEWLMGRFCARIITVSDYDRELGLNAHIAAPEKLITVHNGMPDYPRNRVPAPDARVRMIMVARFAEQKDYHTLVAAMAGLRHLPCSLSLVGNGDASAVQAQIDQAQLNDHVQILGQRADVNDLLNAADIFLLITHWEGFPRSIVEAMRSGLPTIATAVAGVPESVTHGKTGLLVAHQDAMGVAAAITQLVTNAPLRESMGQAARARYEQEFTFEHMFRQTTALYQQVTGLPIYPLAVDNLGSDALAA